MREETAPHPPTGEVPLPGRFAPGWVGRMLERLFAVGVAAGLFYILCTQATPRQPRPIPAAAGPATTQLSTMQPAAAHRAQGRLEVRIPAGVDSTVLRVSVLLGGSYAAPEKDRVMRLLTPEELAQAPLPPGHYTAVVSYRDQVLTGIPVDLQAGKTTPVMLPREELARIELEAALTRQSEGQDADIAHFERVIALDPEHVDARLQLAAHALATGATEEARRHLAVVERQDPHSPHAARIRRLLLRSGRR